MEFFLLRFDFWGLTVLRKRESSDIYKVRGVLRLKENGKGVSVRFEGILVSGGGKRGMWCMSRVTAVEVFFSFSFAN